MSTPVLRLQTYADPGLLNERVLNEIAGRLRASIALLVIMLFLIVGLILIRIASRSWRRVDDYLRQSTRRAAAPHAGSAWEASAQRMRGELTGGEDEGGPGNPDGDGDDDGQSGS